MTITTISSRSFNQDVSKAKRAAKDGPVFITDRGSTAHVLLSIEEYEKLSSKNGRNIAELLSMPSDDDIDFEPPKLTGSSIRPLEFD